MKKLLYLLTTGLVLCCTACVESTEPSAAPTAETATATARNDRGFFYILDATGRHLRSGHLPKDQADEQWLLELQAETTDAQILHIWLDQDFVTVEL